MSHQISLVYSLWTQRKETFHQPLKTYTSRSIHTTWRKIFEERRWNYDPDQKRERIAQLKKDMYRKRTIKDTSDRSNRQEVLAADGRSMPSIVVRTKSEYEHFPASPAGKRYGDPDSADGDREVISERGTKSKLKFLDLNVSDKFFYVYDFCDDWRHEIEIEAILPPDPNGWYPSCIAGARACPPEDCGGVPGYLRLVRPLAVVGSAQPHFDADRFDLKEAQKGVDSYGLLMMTLS